MKAVKLFLGLLLAIGLSTNSFAFNTYWTGGGSANDWWSDTDNWSPGAPSDGDDAFLLEFNSENKDIDYDRQTRLRLNSMTIDGDIELVLSSSMPERLVVRNNEYIGVSNWATVSSADFWNISNIWGNQIYSDLVANNFLKPVDSLSDQARLNAPLSDIQDWLWTNYFNNPSIFPPVDQSAVSSLLEDAQGQVGIITQDGGYHRVGHDGASYPGDGNFYLGAGVIGSGPVSPSHGRGYYYLNAGTFDVYNQNLGGVEQSYNIYSSGDGYFIQTGGENLAGNLFVGVTPGSYGYYELNDGQLTVGQWETIGARGVGEFRQTGGIHQVLGSSGDQGVFVIGATQNGPGTYTMLGGSLYVHSDDIVTHAGRTTSMIIGEQGTGVFNQYDGAYVEIDNDLILGKNREETVLIPNTTQGTGTYNMFGGTLQVNGNEYVGLEGVGVFNQHSGTHVVGNGTLKRDLFVDVFAASKGTYNLFDGLAAGYSGDPELQVSGNTIVGSNGTGTFNHSAGGHQVGGDLVVAQLAGSRADYNMDGGWLNVGGSLVVGDAGDGSFYLDQDTSDTNINSAVIVGKSSGGSGLFSQGRGILNMASLVVGDAGSGLFDHQDGFVTVNGDITVGKEAGSSGTYAMVQMSDSRLEQTSGITVVGDAGSGTFTQSLGEARLQDLVLGKSTGSNGTYNLDAGTLTVQNNIEVGRDGTGTFNLHNGEINVTRITNNDAFNAYNGTINGDVDNFGTFKINDGVVNINGTFTNFGVLNSDPATTNFTNLVVGQDGYLVGGAGDVFNISGNFQTSSTNPLWDTSEARLAFVGAGVHEWQFLGASPAAESMRWGVLELADGAEVNLGGDEDIDIILQVTLLELDGDAAFNIEGTGSLVIDSLILPDGSDIQDRLSRFFGDPDMQVTLNSIRYADGSTVDLSGYTLPGNVTVTPEPASMVLFGLGGAAMAFARRRKNV